jgi:iron-sulfur cluster insertion protein
MQRSLVSMLAVPMRRTGRSNRRFSLERPILGCSVASRALRLPGASALSSFGPSTPFATLSAPLRQQAAAYATPPSSVPAAGLADAGAPIIKLTPKAVLRLKQLAAKASAAAGPEATGAITGLRVSVYEGGCHGMEYRFNLEKNVPLSSLDPEDVVVEQEGAKVILDSISVEKMQGSILDFVQDLQGEMFSIIHNPLAAASCGCGSSFSPKA